jgi:hypothetical protein
MLPYIDVEGLQELPLCLLGRFPDRMTDSIIDKIGKSEELFKAKPKEMIDILPSVQEAKDRATYTSRLITNTVNRSRQRLSNGGCGFQTQTSSRTISFLSSKLT